MKKKEVFKIYELTNPQKNILQMDQVNNKCSSVSHILSVMKLNSVLDTKILKKTIEKIIERNDSFHIHFKRNKDGSYSQFFADPEKPIINIHKINNENISPIKEFYKNFELSLVQLFAFGLVFTPTHTYVFYKSHHIIADGWGMTQVAEQIKEIYSKLLSGETLDNYTKPSYTSLIKREQDYLTSSKYKTDYAFWNKYVSNLGTTRLFHNDDMFQKDAIRSEHLIPSTLAKDIDSFCQSNSISEYAFFLAILSIYFSKIYNSKNMVFGTPFLNRQKRVNEFQSTGLYICNLPLLINPINNNDFLSLCRNINTTNLALFKHANFPCQQIQHLYHKNTNKTDSLFEVGFSYQINELHDTLPDGDKGHCEWCFLGEQNNPLTIHLTVLNHDKLLSFDYWTSCFTQKEINQMNEIIKHLIKQILSGTQNISKLNVLPEEAVEIIKKFNNSGNIQTDNTVVNIFKKIVEKNPTQTALICGEETLTYSELDQKSTNLAKFLINNKLPKGKPIVLFFDKSLNMIISILAVLKAGSCYVPILPNENTSRIEYILKDCNPFCILTDSTHKETPKNINSTIFTVDTIEKTPKVQLDTSSILPESVAYIIYTSGSTGNPKGTMVKHTNIVNLIKSIEKDNTLKASHEDVCMSLLKYSFDASGIDIYTALLFGATLLLVKKEDELNPEKVLHLIEHHHVTRSFLIPKWIEQIAYQEKTGKYNLTSLRILGSGGESLKPYLVQNLIKKYPELKILNLYGPTETTMFTTCKQISKEDAKSNTNTIGRPIYGSRLAVVNSDLEFLPPNTEGELIIYEDKTSIKNIAKGYLNLPKQTENKFVTIYNPITQENVKAYKTGDIVKLSTKGEIEFIGRDDDVVKVNGGYLVALNEVEKKIQTLLGNDFDTYPIAIPFKNTKVIILFIVSHETNISMYSIRNYINNNISFYMKPKKIIEIPEFPRNSSGKIDRKKLKKIAEEYMSESKNRVEHPRTKTEKDIYKVIKKFVAIDTISINDDFIDDLGIDSLDLTNVYTALDKYNLEIQDIYNNPNIKELAKFIDSNQSSSDIKPNLANLSSCKITNQVRQFDMTTVLLTGVTGFLGIHILRDLLLNEKVKKIDCIIRNKINANGKKRLEKMIEYYYNSDPKLIKLIEKKVTIFNGDVTKELLGLDQKSYEQLKSEVTTVINSAANVRHFAKPDQIRKDNVKSVIYLIDFCGSSISLAHISTLSIAGFKGSRTKDITFNENTLYFEQEFENNPYLVSKFEAEKAVLYASNYKRLNAAIFRIGNIMPRYEDGKFQQNATQNVFLLAMKSILDCKMIPKEFYNTSLEFSPVEECSKMIVNLISQNAGRTIYHILNNNEITILELTTLLNRLGCDIVETDLNTFKNNINKYTDEYTKEYLLGQNLNKYSQNLTLKDLEKAKLSWHKTDTEYIKKVIKVIKSL